METAKTIRKNIGEIMEKQGRNQKMEFDMSLLWKLPVAFAVVSAAAICTVVFAAMFFVAI